MPPLPELADDLLREVFLRLRPDDPECLLRASLACKRWHRILTDPVFRRRHRELYRMPSLVGFLHVTEVDPPYASSFVANNPAYGCPVAGRDFPGWLVLDCRHGRVLFVAPSPSLGTQLNYDIIVWDPLTNEVRCLPRFSPLPTVVYGCHLNAAVLCSTEQGCDHSECHGGPFRVAFVWSHPCGVSNSLVTSARVYSSETGNWSEPVSVLHPNLFALDKMPCPSTLVGDTLYFRFGFVNVLEYKLGAQSSLSVLLGPPRSAIQSWDISLMPMEGGGLGCMSVEEDESSLCLRLWSRDASSRCDGDQGWTRGRAIDLEKLLPDGALPSPRWAPDRRFRTAQLLGVVEGTDVICVSTPARILSQAVYMVQFNSGRARKLFDQYTIVIPYYTSFCNPVTGASSTAEGPAGDYVSRVHDNPKLVHGLS